MESPIPARLSIEMWCRRGRQRPGMRPRSSAARTGRYGRLGRGLFFGGVELDELDCVANPVGLADKDDRLAQVEGDRVAATRERARHEADLHRLLLDRDEPEGRVVLGEDTVLLHILLDAVDPEDRGEP